jgi:hypothetical protein
MMIRKLLLPAMLVMGMSASADDFFGDPKGLIGVEVGYMGTEYKKDTGKLDINDNPIINKETTSSPSIGLKLGGESRHYRAFIEGRIWSTSDYDNGASVGGALQYLIPTGDLMNIFLGINGGVVNSINSEWDPYAGADAGINLNFSDDYGLELGGRYSAVDVNSDDYGKINNFYQFYVTAIFKFSGDY